MLQPPNEMWVTNHNSNCSHHKQKWHNINKSIITSEQPNSNEFTALKKKNVKLCVSNKMNKKFHTSHS